MKKILAFAIFCIGFAVTGSAHAALIAHTYSYNQNATNTTTGINTTGANLIVVLADTPGTQYTPVDSQGNTWKEVGTSRMYYVISPSTSSSQTFSIGNSLPNQGYNSTIWVEVFSDDVTGIDASSTGYSSGTTLNTVTPSQSGDLFVGGLNGYLITWTGTLSLSSPSFTVTDPFPWPGGGGTNTNGAMAYYVNSGSSALAPAWTASGYNDEGYGSSGELAAFKIASPTSPDATSVSTTVNGDGARSGDSITVTGTNFGTVATSSAATCNGGTGTGCIQFIVGGNATVASASISSWSNTSITFTVSSTLASNGGASALQVWAANASDTTPLTFYIYPHITAMAALGANAAREYNASDTDGLIMLSGDHFGTSGTSTILGYTATQYGSTGGPCTVAGYNAGTVCLEVPTSIPNNSYSGTVILNRGSDNKQATTTISILPRITAVNPNSTSTGGLVQLLGNHFCQSGTCPVSPNRSSTTNNVLFGIATSSDSGFQNLTGGAGACNGSGAAWSDGEICVDVPAGASVGSASTTITSNGVLSNLFSFTVSQAPPGAPGTPTYSSVGSTTLTANWTAPSIGSASYYSLARATSSNGTYTTITTTTSLSYGDSGLTGNTSYWYEVLGVNASGSGPYSATSTQLTLPGTPGTPTYSSIASTTLTINWTAPAGSALYYGLARATSSNGTYTTITTTTSLSYGDSGLTSSTSYWYEVRGVNATGSGSYSATSTVTTSAASNSPPNPPTQNSPANSMQDVSVTPTFTMTATDPDGNNIQYKVIIYSNSGCTSVVQTDDQSASQTGWSGQNASSGAEYTSGTQGSFTVQSPLAQSTVYYWTASAKDPEGSNTWTVSATCNSFTTTDGLWTTDSGSWSISSNQLTVTPGTGNYVQLHVSGQSIASDIIEFKVKASGASTGDTGAIFRADASSNRYLLGDADYADQLHRIGKTISGSYSTLTSAAATFSASTVYDVRAYANGTTLASWVNGGNALSTTDSALSGAGFAGIGALGNNTFTYTDFSIYTSPTITFSNLPSGGSWSVLNHAGTVIACQTGSSWNLSTYSGQVPIDYDNGGGQIGVWSSNNSCSGSSTATYPSTGLATDIFGGDTYVYTAPSSGGVTNVTTSTTIIVNTNGSISY